MGLKFTKEISGTISDEDQELFMKGLSTLLNDRWLIHLGEFPYINYIKAQLILRGNTTKPGIWVNWRKYDGQYGKSVYDWDNRSNITGISNDEFMDVARKYSRANFALVAEVEMREDFTFTGYKYKSKEDISIIAEAYEKGWKAYNERLEKEKRRKEGNARWVQLMKEHPDLRIKLADESEEKRFRKDVEKFLLENHEVLCFIRGGSYTISRLISTCLESGMNYGFITGPYGDSTPAEDQWTLVEEICNFYWKNKENYKWN